MKRYLKGVKVTDKYQFKHNATMSIYCGVINGHSLETSSVRNEVNLLKRSVNYQ